MLLLGAEYPSPEEVHLLIAAGVCVYNYIFIHRADKQAKAYCTQPLAPADLGYRSGTDEANDSDWCRCMTAINEISCSVQGLGFRA